MIEEPKRINNATAYHRNVRERWWTVFLFVPLSLLVILGGFGAFFYFCVPNEFEYQLWLEESPVPSRSDAVDFPDPSLLISEASEALSLQHRWAMSEEQVVALLEENLTVRRLPETQRILIAMRSHFIDDAKLITHSVADDFEGWDRELGKSRIQSSYRPLVAEISKLETDLEYLHSVTGLSPQRRAERIAKAEQLKACRNQLQELDLPPASEVRIKSVQVINFWEQSYSLWSKAALAVSLVAGLFLWHLYLRRWRDPILAERKSREREAKLNPLNY